MLKAAIVGCGKIADFHAAAIQRIPDVEIVGVCDREPLMARQLFERFPVKQHFSDLAIMLEESKPDVVHITTSPESHFEIARLCMERGCNVYVEKPFTVNAEDARRLVAIAEEKALKLTAGHDDQFGHATRRMRALVQSGYLGGSPVHMESYYCYEIGKGGYAGALLGDKRHWVRRLPGKLLQNIISHGIARIAEYMITENPHVIAYGHTSPLLKSMGETEIIDELRVIISEEERVTAYFTFSSQMRPSLHHFRIYGAKNGLAIDHDQETLIKLRGGRFPSYLERFAPPAILAGQYFGNLITNMGLFLKRDFHMKSGMKCLIESFYHSIRENAPPPISYREIILTARIMDAIFTQLDAQQVQARANEPVPVHSALAG